MHWSPTDKETFVSSSWDTTLKIVHPPNNPFPLSDWFWMSVVVVVVVVMMGLCWRRGLMVVAS